jgi:hypothetical protein
MLKVSDIEKLICPTKLRSVAHPLTAVSARRIAHCGAGGCSTRSTNE